MRKQTLERLMEVPKQKKKSSGLFGFRFPRRYIILFSLFVGILVLSQFPAFEIKINWNIILGILVIALALWLIVKMWRGETFFFRKKKDSGHKDNNTESHHEPKGHGGGHDHGHGHGESFKKKSFWINVIFWTPIIIIIIIVVSMMFPHEARIAYISTREIIYKNDYFIPRDDFRKIKIDSGERFKFYLSNDKDKVYVRTKHGTYIQEYVEETPSYIKRTASGQFIEEKTSIEYGNNISYIDFKALSKDGVWIRFVKSD